MRMDVYSGGLFSSGKRKANDWRVKTGWFLRIYDSVLAVVGRDVRSFSAPSPTSWLMNSYGWLASDVAFGEYGSRTSRRRPTEDHRLRRRDSPALNAVSGDCRRPCNLHVLNVHRLWRTGDESSRSLIDIDCVGMLSRRIDAKRMIITRLLEIFIIEIEYVENLESCFSQVKKLVVCVCVSDSGKLLCV